MNIHESSPSSDRLSQMLATECRSYTASQWRPDLRPGSLVEAPNLPCKRYYVQNLEAQTFGDEVFDLVLTQDVFEHVFHPDRAIAEVARTLNDRGAYIMSVPVVRRSNPSRRRARLQTDGTVENILPAEFHGNPVNGGGVLVTIDWGLDICSYLSAASGMHFSAIEIDDMSQAIRDEFNLTIVGFKARPPDLN